MSVQRLFRRGLHIRLHTLYVILLIWFKSFQVSIWFLNEVGAYLSTVMKQSLVDGWINKGMG
jgi:hypothetical protein